MVYPKSPSFFTHCAAALLLAVPAAIGCATSAGSAAPQQGGPLQPAITTRGGVAYDATKPLDAVLTPKFDEKDPPKAALTYAVTFKGGDGVTVPGMLTVPAPEKRQGPVPCIIVLHGLGGKKEDVFIPCVSLSNKGYATLAIDIAGHGERPKIGGKPVGDLSISEMRTLLGQTVADLRRSVDFVLTRPEIDPRRIGFVGASLGGILGAVFVSDEPRIKGAVLWAAGGDWGKLITTSKHQFAKKYQQSGQPGAAEIETVLAEVDPLTTIAQVSPRPLLFINGDKDEVVPTACTDALFAAAKEPKTRVTLPGGHIPDISTMLAKTATWLDDHVKGTK
jgi:cephalosporin-C deacetylase-like acetyl esterase